MICKYCGAELILKEWMKRIPLDASVSEAFAEISKWERQARKHYQPVGCAVKYGKSGKLMVGENV